MNHKRIEISILVEQCIAVFDYKCGYQAVNRLADGDASLPQKTVIAGALNSEISSANRENWEGEQCSPRPFKVVVLAEALQYLA